MKIREYWTSWRVPKSENRENLNTRKLQDLQYIGLLQFIYVGAGWMYDSEKKDGASRRHVHTDAWTCVTDSPRYGPSAVTP